MAITDGTILRVVASMVWGDGEVNQNVFNAVISGGGGPWDASDVGEDGLDWISEIFTPHSLYLSPDLEGSSVTVYEYDSGDDDWDEVSQKNWNNTPTGTGEPLPRGVAALINARTLNPDVSGKKYIPGNIENRLEDGLWTNTLVTALAALAIEWLTPFNGITTAALWTPVIWSPTYTVAYPASLAYTIPVIPAYQRRRKNNVGI